MTINKVYSERERLKRGVLSFLYILKEADQYE